jgi:uncharacterized protein YlxW (UPF0749 family)
LLLVSRFLIGVLVAAVIAAAIFYVWNQRNLQTQAAQQQRISSLASQVSRLRAENSELKDALAKVQAEENELARQNDLLNKAVATVKATGKLPAKPLLPYPPK